MSLENVVCRCCLSINTETINLFPNKIIKFAEDILNITNIKIIENDNLPQFICLECVRMLELACIFRKQCINSDLKLKLVKQEELCNAGSFQSKLIDKHLLQIDDESIQDHKSDKSIIIESKYLIIKEEEPDFFSKTNDNILDCKPSCVYVTTTDENLSNKQNIKEDSKTKCNICFKSYLNISKHMITHNQKFTNPNNDINEKKYFKNIPKKIFLCNFCGKAYSLISTLRTHLKRHNLKTKYSCDTCNKSYSYIAHLKRHKLLVHEKPKNENKEKKFLCSICGKGFLVSRYLENHLIIHSGVRQYKCEICEKTFNREDSLVSHRRTHTGERPYECKICNKRFSQNTVLKTHMTLHTGKTVKCPLCDKMFTRPSMLKVHNRQHTGEKPYECDVCPSKFFQKCHLNAHKQSHLDTKQFECEICGKKFTHKNTLQQHLFLHNGKPHKCNRCTATFIKKYRFKAHLKIHHGIEEPHINI